MFRASWKHILVGAIALLALTAACQSYAFCGGYGAGCGCGGGWTDCNSCRWNCIYAPHCGPVNGGFFWRGYYPVCTCSGCGGCYLPYYTPTLGCCGVCDVSGAPAAAPGTPVPGPGIPTPAPGTAAPAPGMPTPAAAPAAPPKSPQPSAATPAAPTLPANPPEQTTPSLDRQQLPGDRP